MQVQRCRCRDAGVVGGAAGVRRCRGVVGVGGVGGVLEVCTEPNVDVLAQW